MQITTRDVHIVIQEYCIDLKQLYTNESDRAGFDKRWEDFYRSDGTHPCVYSRAEKDKLTYRSESFIPTKKDDRYPLLLVVGNPASHSVASGMCFAFEGDGKEHRFWKGLREAKLLEFKEPPGGDSFSVDEWSRYRKECLFDLDYDSPFRIGITVFFSLPSPASDKTWSGVSGIRKLLGQDAFNRITEAEQLRMEQVVGNFMPNSGGMLVFQKDAYEAVRQPSDPEYSLDLARKGELIGTYRGNPGVVVMGVAPTRLMLSHKLGESLVRYARDLAAH